MFSENFSDNFGVSPKSVMISVTILVASPNLVTLSVSFFGELCSESPYLVMYLVTYFVTNFVSFSVRKYSHFSSPYLVMYLVIYFVTFLVKSHVLLY